MVKPVFFVDFRSMNQSLQGMRPVATENNTQVAAKFDCQSAVACGIDSRV